MNEKLNHERLRWGHGYAVDVKANGTFEIAGYSQEHLQAFSKRRAQLKELGLENQRQARDLVTIDRPAKGKEVPREELQKGWTTEGAALGINHPKPGVNARIQGEEVDHAQLVRSATLHASERDVSFRREQVERFALESRLGEVSLSELGSQLDLASKNGDLIALGRGRFTTRMALVVEERIQELLVAGKSSQRGILEGSSLKAYRGPQELSPGQKSALELSLASTDQFIAWQGVAGAGKTFAMKEFRSVAEQAGFEVRGYAPSAEAAKVLEVEAKLPATTVARHLASDSTKMRNSREIWIVDEAGLLGAKDALKLMEKAQTSKAKVIFVGDTRQLSSVEAGNPFKLMQNSGISTAHLTESRRQKTQVLKNAVAALSDTRTREGLSLLAKDIFEFKRESTRVKHVASEYVSLGIVERANTLVLAGSNRERGLLTDAIRIGLKEKGVIGNSRNIETLQPKNLSRQEILEASKAIKGDILVFHKDYKTRGIAKGAQYEVLKSDPQWQRLVLRGEDGQEVSVSPKSVPGFLVYETKTLELANGDQIRWRRNDPELGFRNGQDLRVLKITTKSVFLGQKDGRQTEVSTSGRHHLDHNYVSTVYSSQGKTSERVIISADASFGREAMYVAITRAKTAVALFTEDKERMIRNAEFSRANDSAVDLVNPKSTIQETRKCKSKIQMGRKSAGP